MVGSLEFATKAKGVRSIMVMGHTACGAVIGACKDVKMGSLTALLKEIKPAVKEARKKHPKIKEDSAEFHDHVSTENVKKTVSDILKRSQILADLVKEGKLKIVGAMYDLNTGKVSLVE
jgi:carbonic anhydrase